LLQRHLSARPLCSLERCRQLLDEAGGRLTAVAAGEGKFSAASTVSLLEGFLIVSQTLITAGP